MIRNESDVAAVIVEPVVGTNGVLVPPPSISRAARHLRSPWRIMIADESWPGGPYGQVVLHRSLEREARYSRYR